MNLILVILLSSAATLLVSLVVRNLSSGEAKIEHRVAPLFGVADSQFTQSIGHLLGPPIVAGDQVTALHNGDEIFPAMLEAIRGAERTEPRRRPLAIREKAVFDTRASGSSMHSSCSSSW